MLVLSRKVDESIVLFDNGEAVAKITIVESRGGKVRLGIEAEPVIKVVRTELLDRPTSTVKT